jgi:hypothetical protein
MKTMEMFFGEVWFTKEGFMTEDLKVPLESKGALKLHMSNVAYGYKAKKTFMFLILESQQHVT